MDIAQMIDAMGNTAGSVITVLGDFCLDKYLYIDPARDETSVETDLVAYQVHRKRLSAGAGGTVANNLRALGAQAHCIGIVGCDGEGHELLAALHGIGASTRWMVQTDQLCTNTYTKPMRKNPDGSYTERNRLDFRNFIPTPAQCEDALLQNLREALAVSDAVLVVDQFCQRNFCAVTDRVRTELCALALAHPSKLFYADSRAFISEYRNVMVKCNNFELVRAMRPSNTQSKPTPDLLETCGRELYRRNNCTAFVTMGKAGSLVFGAHTTAVPAFEVSGEIDIVGAGDATNAGIVLGLTLGLTPEQAALLGNCVSSLTIQQLGTTGTATPQMVTERLRLHLADL